jgi:hypothetical protein
MLGEHQATSSYTQVGNATGTGCSMAAGLLYGGTWVKGLRQGGRAAFQAYKLTRSVWTAPKAAQAAHQALEAKRIVKLAEEASLLEQTVKKTHLQQNILKSSNHGLNPFKGKTFQEIDHILRSKGFATKGADPLNGKGSYFHPITNRKYYFDHAGKTYRNGIIELPHVDVHYKSEFNNLEKRRFPLGENLYEKNFNI